MLKFRLGTGLPHSVYSKKSISLDLDYSEVQDNLKTFLIKAFFLGLTTAPTTLHVS